MAKIDWNLHDTVLPEDMNALGSEINRQGTGISKLEDRLNIAEYEDITLQPGLQVVNAKRDSRFRLGEIKGRTLINLLGNSGSCDTLQGWPNNGRFTLDSANKVEGSASIKGTILTGDAYVDLNQIIRYDPRKCYVAVGEIRASSGLQARLRMIESQRPGSERASEVIISSTEGKFKKLFFTVPQNAFTTSGTVYFGAVLVGAQGISGNVDALRLYEISVNEYNSLNGLTAEQVAAKYPFVPSGIVGVENPYAIGYGENLLPPLHAWTPFGTTVQKVISPYEVVIPQTAADSYRYTTYMLQVAPHTDYCLSADHNMLMSVASENGHTSGVIVSDYTTAQSIKFNSGPHSEISVWFRSPSIGQAAEYRIKNPMLVIGSEPKPFKPLRNTMLALQTELHANPNDGSEPDVLFEKEGQYFKLAKWGKRNLDSSYAPALGVAPAGYKVVRLDYPGKGGIGNTGFITKYEGKLLTRLNYGASTTAADQFVSGSNGDVHIAVSNADSGWGDSYTPTEDEIKAYFMGWKMYEYGTQASKTSVYSRSDGANKGWTAVNGDYTVGYNALPASVAPGYSPYNLLYRLAKETVEPVVSEGALTLHEGGNVVEVGTGIVLRERANPKQHTNTNWIINSIGSAYGPLLNKVEYLKFIYRNSNRDYGWCIESSAGVFGNQYAYIPNSNFDQYAAYSVTYTKLDKFPIRPITGTLAVNEKALLSDLTSGVAEALQRVSVVEQKKVERNAPGWITPTFLNGSSQFPDGSYGLVGYRKYDDYLEFRGLLSSPNAGVAFRLPKEYCPKTPAIVSTTISNGVTEIRIGGDGAFLVMNPVAAGAWLSLSGIRIPLN
ncbi:hypothetical protein [Paenibacillus vini]|uniref:Uncharacterized protein n=1 Tax=Paenibacillus vini TaxID=1476024 RepID=A0ABQ4MEJ6_9BACL|nr:hypothetical protein [Paenibacillus vini]GIP54420.1 hypothetical protein J42TS3_34550 [Paenibacillus vini]